MPFGLFGHHTDPKESWKDKYNIFQHPLLNLLHKSFVHIAWIWGKGTSVNDFYALCLDHPKNKKNESISIVCKSGIPTGYVLSIKPRTN